MAKSSNKKIVTAAITGANHTPGMSPYLPVGVDGIVKDAVDALDAGAAMVHIHAREEDGQPTPEKDVMLAILSNIKAQRPNGIIAITTGGGMNMTVEQRYSIVKNFRPEMASCNCGSMNFALSDMARLIEKPVYDWEIPFLEATRDKVFKNTYKDIEYCINTMNEVGTRPEFEIFDLGQISTVAYFLKKGIVKKPIYIQFVLGVMGGAALSLENLLYMIDAAKKALGDDIQFSTVAGGRKQIRYEAAMAVAGANVRVGMEDSLYIRPQGDLAKSNAEQVDKICTVLKAMDFEIATSDEAREMLGLKGSVNVGF